MICRLWIVFIKSKCIVVMICSEQLGRQDNRENTRISQTLFLKGCGKLWPSCYSIGQIRSKHAHNIVIMMRLTIYTIFAWHLLFWSYSLQHHHRPIHYHIIIIIITYSMHQHSSFSISTDDAKGIKINAMQIIIYILSLCFRHSSMQHALEVFKSVLRACR